mgnify:FL=1
MSVNGVRMKAEGSELTVFNAVPYYSDTSTSKDPDGLQKRNLLSDTNSRSVKTAVFSPDGTRIAFLAADSTGARSFNLYVVGADGGEATKVAGAGSFDEKEILLEWRE